MMSNGNKQAPLPNPLEVGDAMWLKYHQIAAANPDWVKKEPADKMTDFRCFGFADFLAEFPIQSRAMLVNGEYHSEAFKYYIDKTKKNGAIKRDVNSYTEDQADYMARMWVEYKAKGSNKRRKKLLASEEYKLRWEHTKKNLADEMNAFKKDAQEADGMIEKMEEERIAEMRETLKSLYAAKSKQLSFMFKKYKPESKN